MPQNPDLTLIQNLLQAGQHAEAERRLQEICAGPGADAQSWFFLGAISGMRGDAAGAENGCRKALALNPGFLQAQFNLGIALRDQGRLDEARAELEAVVAKQPQHADALNALGCIYQRFERMDDAERCFRDALARNPAFPDALTNLGNVLASRKCWAEAVDYYRRALAAAPAHHGVAFNLGNTLVELGRFEEAISAYRQSIATHPENVEAHVQLGNTFNQCGKRKEAEQAFREALRVSPGHKEAQYFLAVMGAAERPNTVPPGYVSRLFDGYAETFDDHLVGKLQYRTPEALWGAVQAALAERRDLDVLDLGCGTGLCGALFKPLSRTLAGVDLSPKMVAKARARAVYDELETGELTDALSKREGALDVVLASDVFNYVGDLDVVFRMVARALRPAGLLAFSVEIANAEEGEGYALGSTGRYAHAPAYVPQLAQRYGFAPVSVEDLCIRMEGDQPVIGEIYVLRRAA